MDETSQIPSEPQGKGGVAAMMAQLDKAHTSGKTIPEMEAAPAENAPEAKPAPEATPAAKPAPEAKPAAPAAGTKPAVPVVKPTVKAAAAEDDAELFKGAPPKWHKIYEEQKKKWSDKISSVESKLNEVMNKPQSAANDKRIEDLQSQLVKALDEVKKYQGELTDVDYRRGPEFQKFKDRINSVYTEAVNFTEQAQVTDGDETRKATQGDFDYIRSLPAGPQRNKMARQMFGDEAGDILAFVKEIDNIKRDAEHAVQQHVSTREARMAEQQNASRSAQAEYQGHYDTAMEQYQQNSEWGSWFRDDESDPEGSALFKEGLAELEKVSQEMSSMPISDQAAYGALYRAQVAAFPRVLMALNRAKGEVESFKAELAKMRGVDPGKITLDSLKAGAASQPQGEKRGGIAGAAAAFDDV